MNAIEIIGTQNFMGKEIKVIEGGFGNGQRCITAFEISKIHNMELKEVNKSINRLITKDRLKDNKDYINILSQVNTLPMNIEDVFGVKQSYINRTQCIFILSERGYSKLIKSMDDDESWNVMDKLIDEYFTMREIINSDEQLKAMALLKAVESNGEESALAIKRYSDIRIKEETKALTDIIKTQKPKVDIYNKFIDSNGLYTPTQMSKLYKIKNINSAKSLNPILNENNICYKQGKSWLPYATLDKQWYKLITNEHGTQLKFTPLGVIEIAKILDIKIEEKELDELIND